jgi:hypothetical protein
MKTLTISSIILVLAVADSLAQTTLKREPARGALREGQSVLVDDGSCPKGQIKLVTAGKQTVGTRRTRSCIRRR